MKKLMVVAAAALMAATLSAKSLAEACGQIDSVIEKPEQMTEEMKQLSAADQKAFVAAVNEAIGKLPSSTEEKCAKALNVNRAALLGAAKGNSETVLAEIFTTAPLESLVAINESFSKDLLNRAADPAKVYTDDQFKAIATNLVKKVNEAAAGLDDADVRAGFAALTMIRASNGTPATLADDLAAMLGDSAKVAKEEWFPEALGENKNYDPMLAGTTVETAPDSKSVLAIAGSQRDAVLLDSFLSGDMNPVAYFENFGDYSKINSFDNDLYTRPRTMKDLPWNPDPKPYYGQVVP